jgi:hypothetical protein
VNPVMAVLAGVGVAALRARIARPATRRVVIAALLALAVAVPALDYHALRKPLISASIPPAYAVIARDPQEAALLDLPSGLTPGWALLSSRYMFYQTAHGKFLLDGTVPRLPPDRILFLGRRVDDFATLPYLKYVVVHRDLLPLANEASRRQVDALTALAQRQGRLVMQDATTDVYRLDTFRPETVWSPRTRRAPAASASS